MILFDFEILTHGICHAESGVGVDVRLPEAQSVDEPEELLVPVHVLRRPQGMGHSLDAVHDGASKVVGRVHLVLGPRGRMRLGFAAVDGGVAHAAVVRLHVHLGPDGALGSLGGAGLHLAPQLHVLLHGIVPTLGLLPRLSLHFHCLQF